MSDQLPAEPRKRRKNTEFWRACRYLGPYRRIVTISIHYFELMDSLSNRIFRGQELSGIGREAWDRLRSGNEFTVA